jgi:hypothetical protein
MRAVAHPRKRATARALGCLSALESAEVIPDHYWKIY